MRSDTIIVLRRGRHLLLPCVFLSSPLSMPKCSSAHISGTLRAVAHAADVLSMPTSSTPLLAAAHAFWPGQRTRTKCSRAHVMMVQAGSCRPVRHAFCAAGVPDHACKGPYAATRATHASIVMRVGSILTLGRRTTLSSARRTS